MPHIIKRGKRYHYKRRVPTKLREYDLREHVVIPLETDSEIVAHKKSIPVNEKVELYWNELIETGTTHSSKRFEQVTKLCGLLNLTYQTSTELAEAPLHELTNRLNIIEQVKSKPKHVEALAGGVSHPSITVSEGLSKFFDISHNRTVNKSENQIRKWRNPYKRAIRNFISVVGNTPLDKLARDDVIAFRDWWIARIRDEDYASDSANKELIALKSVVESVNDHLRLGLDTSWLFQKITLETKKKTIRQPLENTFIQDQILNLDNHIDLNDDATYFLFAMADTGARPSELVALDRSTIFLDTEVPYISIKPSKMHSLKTAYSERNIPLVGCALHAFQKFPNGFEKYRDRSDSLSTFLNKYLRAKNLLPSPNHSVYSLRHSFQDNLNRIGVPDRYQAQLMGHKFHRPEYGQGADLKQKQDYLLKMCFEILN